MARIALGSVFPPAAAIFVSALAVTAFVGAHQASAQETQASVPAGSCFEAPVLLPAEEVQYFMNDPAALLEAYPGAGIGLTGRARGLAGSEPASVDLLIAQAAAATPAQQAAIAAGLAQAASACVTTRPDIATYIQEQVAESGQAGLVTAFIVTTGEVETAAVGGAGGVGGAGTGGGVGGSIGGSAGGGGSNLASGYSASGGGSSFSFGGGGGSFTEASEVLLVSPTK